MRHGRYQDRPGAAFRRLQDEKSCQRGAGLCDGNFIAAIAKGDRRAGGIPPALAFDQLAWREAEHGGEEQSVFAKSRLNVGVKQIAVGCNKLDCDTAG